jgi:hypothetical protein
MASGRRRTDAVRAQGIAVSDRGSLHVGRIGRHGAYAGGNTVVNDAVSVRTVFTYNLLRNRLEARAFLLLIEVVCLNSFYGVVFAPGEIGWDAAGAFGGCVIAFGVLLLFDNCLWPDPAEGNLMESLATSLAHARSRFLEASSFYLDNRSVARPPFPPPTSALPVHMTLLEQAIAEGVSERRRAIPLATITRVARIGLEVDRLIIAARQNAPGEIRAMLRPEIEASVEAIAATLDQIARQLPTQIAVGPDGQSSESRLRARAAMDGLAARMIQLRPKYIATASSTDIENTADVRRFTDCADQAH